MSRKEVWNKAINRHGRLKVYTYMVCLPVILSIYGLAYALMFIGAIGEIIKVRLDNI